LESYHPYLQPQKVSKNPKNYCIYSSLPKNAKSCFGFLGTLGFKYEKYRKANKKCHSLSKIKQ
jgi:hypothetical protein